MVVGAFEDVAFEDSTDESTSFPFPFASFPIDNFENSSSDSDSVAVSSSPRSIVEPRLIISSETTGFFVGGAASFWIVLDGFGCGLGLGALEGTFLLEGIATMSSSSLESLITIGSSLEVVARVGC